MNEFNLRNIAYVNSQVACALIEMEAMKTANKEHEFEGRSPAYSESEFLALLDKYGLHHNAVLTTLQGNY